MKAIRSVSRNETGANVQFIFFLLKMSPFYSHAPAESWKVIFQSNRRPAWDRALECKDKAWMIDWLPTVKCTANNSSGTFLRELRGNIYHVLVRNEILSWEIVEIPDMLLSIKTRNKFYVKLNIFTSLGKRTHFHQTDILTFYVQDAQDMISCFCQFIERSIW